MLKQILLFGLLSVSFVSNAQNEKVLMHPTLDEEIPVGIFVTFEEFKENKANPEYKLNIDPKRNMEKASLTERYKGIPVITTSGEEKGIKPTQMFGYCDGVDMYIAHGTSFFKIEDYGLYSVFTYVSGASSGDYGTASTTSTDYILDMNTGKISKLSNGLLQKVILANYPDLQAKFKGERMKSTMIRWYVTEANLRAKK